MPWIGELKNWIKAEAIRLGGWCSDRTAHSIARSVWLQNADEDDLDGGLHDLNLHADPTATKAIRQVLREMFAAKAVAS